MTTISKKKKKKKNICEKRKKIRDFRFEFLRNSIDNKERISLWTLSRSKEN
jgi:hypothetical protein